MGGATLVAACAERADPDAALADSVYIEVVARLRMIATPTDSAESQAADSARARVLTDYGVAPEELLAVAEVVGREPERSRAVWEQISAAVDSIREAEGLGPELLDDVRGIERAARTDSPAPTDSPAVARADDDSAVAVPDRSPQRGGRIRPVAGQPIQP